MSVLDRMNNFSSSSKHTTGVAVKSNREGLPFDDKTVQGYYFNSLIKEGFNLDEMKPIIETSGNQLVLAIAGSGKTTFLEFKIIYDIITGIATRVIDNPNGGVARVLDSILVSTFSRSGANELKEKALYWQRRLGYTFPTEAIHFNTLHGEFKSVLTQIGVNTNILSNKELSALFRQSVQEIGIQRSDGSRLTNEDYRIMESIVAYRRNRLDDQRYNHPSCCDYDLLPAILDNLVERFKQNRRATGKLDFEDLQEILYDALKVNANVRQLVANRFKFIYLDEFQDTSQIQYEIMKYYAVGAKQVLAVGDDDQTIYTWRGSDINIITKMFEAEFKPIVQKLSVNHRCPSNILNPIAHSIALNTNRHVKEIKSANEGGVLQNYSYNNIKDMSDEFIKEVSSDIISGKSIAILCRTNFDGAIPAFVLELKRLAQFGITDGMTLDSPLPKKLADSVSLLLDRYSPAVKTTLEMLVTLKNKHKVGEFLSTCKNTGKSLLTVDRDDIKYSFPELLNIVDILKAYLAQNDDFGAFRYLLSYLRAEAFKGSSPFCMNARAYIDMLLFLLDSEEFEDLHDYRDRVKELSIKLQARVNKIKADITITTAHDAKGHEWDSVYIWNDTNQVFPSSKSNIKNTNELEEERRVHYIAWTRARMKLTTLSLANNESMFLLETGVKIEHKQEIGGALKKGASLLSRIEQEAEEMESYLNGESIPVESDAQVSDNEKW